MLQSTKLTIKGRPVLHCPEHNVQTLDYCVDCAAALDDCIVENCGVEVLRADGAYCAVHSAQVAAIDDYSVPAIIGTDDMRYAISMVPNIPLERRWELFPICDGSWVGYSACNAGFFDHFVCDVCHHTMHVQTSMEVYLSGYPYMKRALVCPVCYRAPR